MQKENENSKKSSTNSKSFIKFHFSDGRNLSINEENFLSLNPSLLKNNNLPIKQSNDNSIIITLPKDITKEDLTLYVIMLENSSKSLNDENFFSKNEGSKAKGNKILNLLKISDFFNNEDFNVKLINDVILPYNNDNIIIDLLNYSYKKLCDYSEQKETINNVYFDLFYQSLENISKNEKLVLFNLNRIKFLDKKIIDEIIEKTFQNLIYGNTLLIDENKEINNPSNINDDSYLKNLSHTLKNTQFKELINVLLEIKNKKNFFDLLTSEYAFLLSKESIDELKNLPHPSLQVDVHFSEYSYYSQEFPLEIILNHKKIILIVSYKKSDQSFNVCIKLSKNDKKKKNINSILEIDKISEEMYLEENSCFKIFTFLTHVMITKGPEKVKIATQNNLLSLSDNKSIYTILKISNFDNELRNFLIREPDKEYFSVIVQIKLCYIYSALGSYLLKEFNEFYKDPNVCKISKQLLTIILENKIKDKFDDCKIVETILLWLQDEINIKEDISNLFNSIKWENINDDTIFELIIKYSHIIVGNKSLEKIFIDTFEKKYNNSIVVGNILKSLFCAGKKIDYCTIYSKMKKSEKYNKVYKYFNSEAKFKGNFFGDYSSLSKDSLSLKEGMQMFMLNNSNNNKKENNDENPKELDNCQYMNSKNTHSCYITSQSNTIVNHKINSDKKIIEKNAIKNNKDIIFNNIKENNKNGNNQGNYTLNQNNNTSPNIINNKKKSTPQIVFYRNNANFLNKNLSLMNIKQQRQSSKLNLNKKNNRKQNDMKKINVSYYKKSQNIDKNNISNVSININNISNINISNNDYSNYKTQNNDYFLKNQNNNDQSITLTFYSNKSNEKLKSTKNIINKYEKNLNKFRLKLFSTGDSNKISQKISSNNNNNKNTHSYINDKNNKNLKTQNCPKKYNNLLSSILNYEKIVNKSTIGNKKNIHRSINNKRSIRKMFFKSTKKDEKSQKKG